MTVFSSDFGQRLFELLPAVYRSRDNGDLARYLDGCGHLLDLFDQTLRQRLADAFPELSEGLSQSMLADVRNKDVGPAGDSLRDIVSTIRGFSVEELDVRRKRSWWDRLLGTYRDQPEDGHVAMAVGLRIITPSMTACPPM